MPKARLLLVLAVAACFAVGIGLAGCVNIDTPDQINVGSSSGRRPIDSSRVPPTKSHEEARQKIAQSYERIRYLEAKVRDLEKDKDELKDKRDEYKRKYKREKDRHDD